MTYFKSSLHILSNSINIKRFIDKSISFTKLIQQPIYKVIILIEVVWFLYQMQLSKLLQLKQIN